MTKKDWQEAGDQIRDLVQNAIDSGDYSELSNTITNVVNDAVDGVQDALKNSLGQKAKGSRQRPMREGVAGHPKGEEEHYAQSRETTRHRQEAAERIRKSMQEKTYHPVAHAKTPGLIAGKAMKWTGYSLGGIFALTAGILSVVSGTTGIGLELPIGIIDILLLASVALGVRGSRQEGLVKRFRRYQQVIGERTFCLIDELSAAIGKKPKFVQKDLRKMISNGFFPQAYLDKKETCLITDQQTYQQYLQTEKAYEARSQEKKPDTQRAEAHEKEDSGTAGKPTTEYEKLLAEGQSYIHHIHVCNDKIEDPIISEKLDCLEMIVTRIFTEARRNPEVADDLKKMMSYYLPTTKKLLDAYCELDEQPVQGENIETTKKEIAATLDTLNNAFAKLLDDLFEEKAWDISSDISVLNTMLAQEGLTEGAFDKK